MTETTPVDALPNRTLKINEVQQIDSQTNRVNLEAASQADPIQTEHDDEPFPVVFALLVVDHEIERSYAVGFDPELDSWRRLETWDRTTVPVEDLDDVFLPFDDVYARGVLS